MFDCRPNMSLGLLLAKASICSLGSHLLSFAVPSMLGRIIEGNNGGSKSELYIEKMHWKPGVVHGSKRDVFYI